MPRSEREVPPPPTHHFHTQAMSRTTAAAKKRVGVVGGGAAGLATCRCLLESGHTPVVFEACRVGVGGIWLGREAWRPVIYDGLVTNLPHQVMQFHDLPFNKEETPRSYLRARDVGRYLQEYADRHRLNEHVILGARVDSVVRNEDDAEWVVRYTKDGHACRAVFDSVVVANGHYAVPHTPFIKGVQEWSRRGAGNGAAPTTITHAAEYRLPHQYAGRVVLVVGSRSSGTDIAREVSEVADLVYVFDPTCDRVEQRGNRVRLPGKNEGITEEGFPVLSTGVVLKDKPITDIIFATGYKYDFPFLDLPSLGLSLTKDGKFLGGLQLQIIPRKYPDSLFFLGLPMAVAPFPLFEPQARLVTAILSGTADVSGLDQEVAHTHTLAGDQWGYVKDLLRRAGIEGLPEALRRIDLVTELYNDRVSRQSKYPGDPDEYRHVDYTVDWATGRWTGAPSHASASKL